MEISVTASRKKYACTYMYGMYEDIKHAVIATQISEEVRRQIIHSKSRGVDEQFEPLK